MKSKKLLISLTVVAALVIVIIVLVAVLTVQKVYLVYHGFDGHEITPPTSDGISTDDILSAYRGKNIVFLSKANLLDELNKNPDYKGWHFFAVVKHFPNEVEIHVVKRTAVAKLLTSTDGYVYVDCFGYITEKPEQEVIDITSAFQVKDTVQNDLGKLDFASEQSDARLQYVLAAIRATWQCMVDIPDMVQVLGESDVFQFDSSDENMTIKPKLGGKIVVQSPEVDFESRLIKAYGVYYNNRLNIQDDNYTVTVYKNGRITTPSK